VQPVRRPNSSSVRHLTPKWSHMFGIFAPLACQTTWWHFNPIWSGRRYSVFRLRRLGRDADLRQPLLDLDVRSQSDSVPRGGHRGHDDGLVYGRRLEGRGAVTAW
jgi:hypothetical protein